MSTTTSPCVEAMHNTRVTRCLVDPSLAINSEAVANYESFLARLQLDGVSTNDVQVIVPRIPLAALIAAHFDEQIIIAGETADLSGNSSLKYVCLLQMACRR